ncbi:hypothetical protein [Nocardioides mangrovi]|uniref:Uncharacterized protein n=1 Tax=Nocardioides mangrovi TaxID=2874580 RepID=A0ABS7UEN6_9ACTN|nr:hypothetical protein [Nocardioides mangrovi]MBZ5739319.1 hypothetical protein [Nocardioides mangrovi]
MCRPVSCRRCGKTTWSGCGLHVDQVMAGVPKADRCPGHDDEPRSGLLSRLLRRG